jgi:hypothetical protein
VLDVHSLKRSGREGASPSHGMKAAKGTMVSRSIVCCDAYLQSSSESDEEEMEVGKKKPSFYILSKSGVRNPSGAWPQSARFDSGV